MTEICTRRPDLCDPQGLAREEPRAAGPGAAEAARELLGHAPGPELPAAPGPPPVPAPPRPTPLHFQWEAPIRVRRIFNTYWRLVNTPFAQLGDVVVVKSPQEAYVLRREKKAERWLDPPGSLYIQGRVEKQYCIYGFILRGSVELIAQLFRSGMYAIVLGCDRRAVVKPPRSFELQQIWRQEGYIVNASPARLAVVRLDGGAKPRIALSFFNKGCPIYSLWANQLLQLIGVSIQLVC